MIGGQGTWSAVLGPAGASNPGYWTTGDQTLPGGAKTFTGGPWTFTRTAQSGSETIATFKVSDDAANYIAFINGSGTDSRYDPFIRGVVSSTQSALILQGLCGSDSGSAAAIAFDVRTGGGATLSNKTLFGLLNNNTTVFSIIPINSGANGAVTWGTQTGAAPAFTTRGAGNRLILYSAISGSKVDNAIGVTASGVDTWYSVQEATTSYAHRWYAGTTDIMSVRGDGRLTTTGGRVKKLRVATTSPVTVAVTDTIICTNLAVAGAVAVNLPSSPTTGTEFVIKDDKGDANANNITITPAAGNIDGGGTLVLNAAYASAHLVYNGTQWNRITG